MKTAQEYAAEIRAAYPDLPEAEVRESAIAHHLSDVSKLDEGTDEAPEINLSAFEW